MKYTITFDHTHEKKFREVLSRLDEGEYTIVKDIDLVPDLKPHQIPQKQTIIDMDPEACLTFRLGMREVKIRRERTEEELAAEKALQDANTIKIKVIVPKDDV
ncbi:MAG TPA: hypothetical protein VIY47_03400 [Ignavibacteriaceae bacterium]